MSWALVGQVGSLPEAEDLADTWESKFEEGARGKVEVELPFTPPSWVIDSLNDTLAYTEVHLSRPVYVDGQTLVVEFEKGNPGIFVIVAAIAVALAILLVAGAVSVKIYKLEPETFVGLGLGAIALVVAGLIFFFWSSRK